MGGSHQVSKTDVKGLKVFANSDRTSSDDLVVGADNVVVDLNNPMYTTGKLTKDGKVIGIELNKNTLLSLVNVSAPVKSIIHDVFDTSLYKDGAGVSFILDRVIPTLGGEVESAARLAVLGGTYLAAKSVLDSNADAVAGRFGIGNSGTKVVKAGNSALWGNITYKTNKSNDFKADDLGYGAKVSNYGGIVGLDYTLSDTVTLGGFITVGIGKAKGDRLGATADYNYHGLGLYAGMNVTDNMTLLADVSYTKLNNDVTDSFSLKTDADTKILSAGVTAKADFSFDSVKVSPNASLRFTRYDMEDSNVKSSMYGLISKYSADNLNVVSIPLGVDLSKEINKGDWTFIPGASFKVTYNSKTDATGNITFIGAKIGASLKSEVLDRVTYGAGIKFDAIKEDTSFGAALNFSGSENTKEVSAQVNASYMF